VKYIAYGSNMVKEQMAYRCPDAKLIGTGYIERARLEFYLHATVERSRIKGARVPVAIWEISDADEQRLDRYEGFPNYYTKEEWQVRMADGSEIKGMIYLMKRIRTAPPTLDYYKGIQSAYEELGLGSEIKTVLQPALCRSIRRMQRG
jgi:hypothetical protein